MTNQQKIDQAFERFNQRIRELEQILPQVLANEAINDVIENFETESFNNTPWPKRKDKKDLRKLLVKSGILRRSPQVYGFRARGFTLGSDIPYASVHNNGEIVNKMARSETFTRNRITKGIKKGRFRKGVESGQGFSFKAYSYKMPMRRFIGDSTKLRRRLYNAGQQEYLNIMNKK